VSGEVVGMSKLASIYESLPCYDKPGGAGPGEEEEGGADGDLRCFCECGRVIAICFRLSDRIHSAGFLGE
jgi:hypothetical protein